MADRKQFVNTYKSSGDLVEALKLDSEKVISEEELTAQRISFAYGNAGEDSKITKDSVQQAAGRSRLCA